MITLLSFIYLIIGILKNYDETLLTISIVLSFLFVVRYIILYFKNKTYDFEIADLMLNLIFIFIAYTHI